MGFVTGVLDNGGSFIDLLLAFLPAFDLETEGSKFTDALSSSRFFNFYDFISFSIKTFISFLSMTPESSVSISLNSFKNVSLENGVPIMLLKTLFTKISVSSISR